QKGIKVTGNVSDEKGEPLIGVTIILKNDSTVHALTDMNGNYSIIVPERKSVLSFRYIGFIPKEEVVNNRKVVNVQMVEDVGQLDEVVVVAYGAQKKESVVGSITTVEPAKLNVSTSRSLSNNLAGTVTGVIGVQRSGEPGYDNSSFWIRGISTFQDVGKDPLVLVDGIERSLNNIDVEEIESFSVLKDAAASAVYGVRGANGVILINTKRGHVGKPRVVVKSEFAFTQPIKLPSYIGAADYMQLLDDVLDDTGQSPMYADRIAKTRAGYDPDLYPDVNWIDAISRDHAANQRITVDVSGGSENLRYSFVAAVYNERGILTRDKSLDWDPTIKLQRYNVRSNVDLKLSPTTQVRFNIGGYLQDRNSSPESTDQIFSRAFRFTPFMFPIRYSSGEIPAWQEEGNPWAMATQSGFARSTASKIETLFSLEQDLKFLTPGLKIKGTFSFDRYSTGKVTRSKKIEYWNAASGRNEEGELILAQKQQGGNFLGTSKSAEYGDKSIYMEASLNYDRTFADKHAVSAMLLFNRRHYDKGESLPYRNQGLAGRASYTYSGKYVGEFNFGYNGSENFAKGKRYGFFPSGAIGWIVSEEAFMQPLRKVISKLKLRASYGQVGNANLGGRRFAYLSTITDDYETLNMYKWGLDSSYGLTGMAEGEFAVQDLTWEIVNKMNLGVELGFLNGMIDLQLDYFDERRKDIFMPRESVPMTAGFMKQPWKNFGKVTNQGVEVSLNVNKQFGKDLFVSLMGTFTYAHNEITEKDEPSAVVGTNRAETGHPVGQLTGYIAEGLFTADDFEDVSTGKLKEGIPTQSFVGKLRPGDIRYRDVNGDGKVDVFDKSPIGGTKDPEIVYGFGLNMKYKNLDFGALFQGIGRSWNILGSSIIPGANRGVTGNMFTNANDRWTVDNPSQNVFYPRLDDGINSNNNQSSTWWLRNMSFLRLKNIELGYSLPKNLWRNTTVISGIRLFVRGTNLLTFSKFDLWDPEVENTTGAAYPIMKSLSAGFEIKF
ncbi:MAG TPA: SusC/RagA family protein, partial [Paraprevotella xylaniphila]|nr:SusC/RagA family protein [Paraprevotella xylaniphila]